MSVEIKKIEGQETGKPDGVALPSDRQHLIDTAVRFLLNPKVISTSIENKKLFLAKKGMAKSEIEMALKLANCTEQPTQANSSTQNEMKQEKLQVITQQLPVNKPSFLSRLIKWIKKIIMAGCFTFTAYKILAKNYLMSKKKNEIKKADLNEQLSDSIKEMRNSLNSLKDSVDIMNNSIQQIKNTPSTSGAFDETSIRGELQSVKNLLLNRNQFPSVPTPNPIIPSWQLQTTKNKEKSNDEIQRELNNNQKEQKENEEEEIEEKEVAANEMNSDKSDA